MKTTLPDRFARRLSALSPRRRVAICVKICSISGLSPTWEMWLRGSMPDGSPPAAPRGFAGPGVRIMAPAAWSRWPYPLDRCLHCPAAGHLEEGQSEAGPGGERREKTSPCGVPAAWVAVTSDSPLTDDAMPDDAG